MSDRPTYFFRYLAFAILAFVIALYLQFPYDLFLPKLIAKVEPQLSPDRSLRISAKHVKPYWLTGLTLEGFALTLQNEAVFEAERVSVRLRVLPLLLRTQSVGFRILAYQGELGGHAGRRKQDILGKIKWKNLAPDRIRYLEKRTGGLPLFGRASGSADFRVNPAKPAEGFFNGELQLSKAKLGPGQIYGFEIAKPIALDDQGQPARLKVEMQKGIIKPKLKINNPDGRLEIDGSINFSGDLRSSPMDVSLTFAMGESVASMFPSFVLQMPALAQSRNGDGSHTFRMTGTLFQSQMMPFKKL